MSRFTPRQALQIACLLGCLSLAAGCHSATEPGSDGAALGETSATGEYPAIHVVLGWESLVSGSNSARAEYENWIDTCKDAGHSVTALTADEIKKLGTGKVELWTDARGAYGRETSWSLGVTDEGALLPVCQPKLVEQVQEGSDDYTVGQDPMEPVDPADLASLDEQATLAKTLGFQRIGEAQVGGQPCTRWRSKDHEVCEWSGGRTWGFDDGPAQPGCVTQGPMDYLNPILLEAKPTAGATGCIVQLQSMTVSKGQLTEVDRALGATETGE